MLYIIGLGLGDERDITLRGLEAVKKSQKLYIESYTSLLSFGISKDGISTLEKLYGKPLIIADREMVEEKADDMLLEACEFDVAFLVVGDPFGGKKQYEPPTFMTIGVAIDQLLEVEQLRGESAYNEDTLCVGFARLGSENQMVVAGSMKQLRAVDFGPPLHCLTIVGKTHPVEEEMLDFYRS
ncbi:Tetrapyrrole methylase [Cynara cardunculus var. scolymus]|uniref:diphthine methyl ester synthase n=1 Tax=Cynara cardunculus var. scolymus TaxID=59895 RepID=A0A103YET1_CYNCS|nr:Tetrapyrrole methylase [Cynara cardunculus var. scolymus]